MAAAFPPLVLIGRLRVFILISTFDVFQDILRIARLSGPENLQLHRTRRIQQFLPV